MWPRRKRAGKPERFSAAREERKRSERLAAEAEDIVRDFQEIRERNHFADAIRTLLHEGYR